MRADFSGKFDHWIVDADRRLIFEQLQCLQTKPVLQRLNIASQRLMSSWRFSSSETASPLPFSMVCQAVLSFTCFAVRFPTSLIADDAERVLWVVLESHLGPSSALAPENDA